MSVIVETTAKVEVLEAKMTFRYSTCQRLCCVISYVYIIQIFVLLHNHTS